MTTTQTGAAGSRTLRGLTVALLAGTAIGATLLADSGTASAQTAIHSNSSSAYCNYLQAELKSAPANQKAIILQEIRDNCS